MKTHYPGWNSKKRGSLKYLIKCNKNLSSDISCSPLSISVGYVALQNTPLQYGSLKEGRLNKGGPGFAKYVGLSKPVPPSMEPRFAPWYPTSMYSTYRSAMLQWSQGVNLGCYSPLRRSWREVRSFNGAKVGTLVVTLKADP